MPSFVVIAAFCVRVLLCVSAHRFEDAGYAELPVIGKEAGFLAWSLASGKGFSNPFPGYDTITAWLAPVFPALWSIGFRIFPPNTSSGGVYFCQLMNSAFSAFTCWPIFWLGRRVFGFRIGVASAWAWAFLPIAILLPLEWAWDQSLSALLLVLLLCANYKLSKATPKSRAWGGLGLLWGFAALVNPTLCVLLPFLLGWLVFCRWQSGFPWFKPIMKLAFFLILAVLPWIARDYFALDGFVPIKSNFGVELWLGNNGTVTTGVWSPQNHPMNNLSECLSLIMNGEPGYAHAKQRAALAFIQANPARFAQLLWRRLVDTWVAVYDSREDKWMSALHLGQVEVYFCGAFSVLAAAGLILALRKSIIETFPLAVCIVILPIPYYLTHTSLRYRHPIDPMLTLFVIFAAAQIISKLGFRSAQPESTPGSI